MALMNNLKGLLDITPEQYYLETLRPYMLEVRAKVKYDPVLTDTLEEVLNKANEHAINKKYSDLAVDFDPLTFVLLDNKSQYKRTKSYMASSQEEKDYINELGNKVQQILEIIRCTKEEEPEEKPQPRGRIGYDENKGENILP